MSTLMTAELVTRSALTKYFALNNFKQHNKDTFSCKVGTTIMKFVIESVGDSDLDGVVNVFTREVDEKFELSGTSELRKMRIVTGKLLGIKSLPRKQRFDRAKYRRNIREGKAEYQRGDA